MDMHLWSHWLYYWVLFCDCDLPPFYDVVNGMSMRALFFIPMLNFVKWQLRDAWFYDTRDRGSRRRIWKMSINAGGPPPRIMRNLWLNWKTSIHMGDIWKVQQGTASFARHPDFISQAYFRSKLFCSCEAIHMHIGKVDLTQKWCTKVLPFYTL